ncbi:hypothetical protein KIN20_001714 [Parelaphostrongylus tenuis]|uniref:Uncharacterized protein n=1 Tax=Parelaphostrongylus tenuis TaxID=148309 RepID=A0AAD5QCU7_PARTN|nr:hypothetical protein KIN20_001714 [Parelaphostrongylus tenuis]
MGVHSFCLRGRNISSNSSDTPIDQFSLRKATKIISATALLLLNDTADTGSPFWPCTTYDGFDSMQLRKRPS